MTDTNKGVASIGVGSALYGPAAAVIANTGGRFTGIKALTLYDEPAGGWQNASTPNAGIIPSDETATDNFGLRAVAIQGDIIVVGALGATRDGNSAEGAAYIFQLK